MEKQNEYRNRIKFDNGYTASVVSHGFSYGGETGLFEVGVIHGDKLVYDTPVTSDVIGYLGFQGVADILEQIKNLPPRE